MQGRPIWAAWTVLDNGRGRRPPLSAAQRLRFAHLVRDRITVSELARRLGISRQAAGECVPGLVKTGLLQTGDDPRRRNGRLISLTERERALTVDAHDILGKLEAELGAERAATLRATLLDLGLPNALQQSVRSRPPRPLRTRL